MTTATPPIAPQRAAVVAEARRWLGTPWQHRQRLLGAGVDCAQLLIAVYESAGLLAPGSVVPGEYPMDWHLHRDEDRFLAAVLPEAVRTDQPRPGDIALFSYGRCASHGAIVIEPDMIVHSYRAHGAVVISDLRHSAELRERLVGYYMPHALAAADAAAADRGVA